IIVKDNIDVAGTPSAAANAMLKNNVRAKNAPVVQRMLDAGAIFFARANMHELAGGGTCSNPSFGWVRNPYDTSRIPGGSSGGTAAAIPARIVPAGLGTDTAGSVRIPSALSGTSGLRPSIYGGKLYPDDGIVPLALDLDTIGPMARTVADVALLHTAITGEAVPSPADLRRVRLGIPRNPYWQDIDSEVLAISERALEQLRDAGATLVEVDVTGYYEQASNVYLTLVMYGLKHDLDPYLREIGAPFDAAQVVANRPSLDTKALFERAMAMEFTPEAIARARTTLREEIVNRYAGVFSAQWLDAIVFLPDPLAAPAINPAWDRAEDEVEINGRKVNANF